MDGAEWKAHVDNMNNPSDRKAYVVTGPTSGMGRSMALELAKHGTVVLVGRDRAKLDALRATIEAAGQHAVSVVCDLADLASVRRAAAEIVALPLHLVGLINNAGLQQQRVTKNAQGIDLTFATNHLGPFALTEALVPHLSDGANVVFLGSGTEDPAEKMANDFGFRGGRYISAEASAHGEWTPGGSTKPGQDAYATSKQCNVLTAKALARETPRLRFNAFDPGLIPGTGLAREGQGVLLFLWNHILPLAAHFMPRWSTPKRAGRVVMKILNDPSGATGVYYDDGGKPQHGSTFVRDSALADRVVAETRALLATLPS